MLLPFDYDDRLETRHELRQPGIMHHVNDLLCVFVGIRRLLCQQALAVNAHRYSLMVEVLEQVLALHRLFRGGAAETTTQVPKLCSIERILSSSAPIS